MALSTEQFSLLKTRLTENKMAGLPVVSTQGANPSFLKRVLSDLEGRAVEQAGALERQRTGKQSLPSTLLQIGGSVAGTMTDVAGEAVKSVGDATGLTEPVKEYGGALVKALSDTAIGKAALEAISGGMESYDEWKTLNPVEAKNLESVMNIASLIPAERGASLALKGADAASDLASATARVGGRALKTAGEKTTALGIRPVKQAERLLDYRAETTMGERITNRLVGERGSRPVTTPETTTRLGIKGTQSQVGVQAKRTADALYEKDILPAIKESKAVFGKDDLFSKVEERIAGIKEPGKRKAYTEAYEAIKDDFKDTNLISLEEAQKIKSGLDEFTPEKMFKGKNVANEYKVLQKDIADAIREKTYAVLPDKYKTKFLDWGNLQDLQKMGVTAIGDAIIGPGGTFTGLSKLWNLAAIPVSTVGGQVLYRVGNALEFLGTKGVKTFGEFAEKQGMKIPTK